MLERVTLYCVGYQWGQVMINIVVVVVVVVVFCGDISSSTKRRVMQGDGEVNVCGVVRDRGRCRWFAPYSKIFNSMFCACNMVDGIHVTCFPFLHSIVNNVHSNMCNQVFIIISSDGGVGVLVVLGLGLWRGIRPLRRRRRDWMFAMRSIWGGRFAFGRFTPLVGRGRGRRG